MALLLHHRDAATRAGTVLRALLTLALVTAVIAAGVGLATLALSRIVVAVLQGVGG